MGSVICSQAFSTSTTFFFTNMYSWVGASALRLGYINQHPNISFSLKLHLRDPHGEGVQGCSPLRSVGEAAMFAGPQLFELHLASQISEGRFTHVTTVSMGPKRLGYQGLCTHLQDQLVVVIRT